MNFFSPLNVVSRKKAGRDFFEWFFLPNCLESLVWKKGKSKEVKRSLDESEKNSLLKGVPFKKLAKFFCAILSGASKMLSKEGTRPFAREPKTSRQLIV